MTSYASSKYPFSVWITKGFWLWWTSLDLNRQLPRRTRGLVDGTIRRLVEGGSTGASRNPAWITRAPHLEPQTWPRFVGSGPFETKNCRNLRAWNKISRFVSCVLMPKHENLHAKRWGSMPNVVWNLLVSALEHLEIWSRRTNAYQPKSSRNRWFSRLFCLFQNHARTTRVYGFLEACRL